MRSETQIPCNPVEAAGKNDGPAFIRGAFALTLCNGISQVINYGIHIGIGRFLSLGLYGYYGIIVSTVSILEVILRWGLSKAVAFHVARDREQAKPILKKALQMQAVYSLICFFIFFSLTDRLAAMLGDPEIASYLRWGAFFILLFAYMPVYGGVLNGVGAFRKQGAMTVIRSLVMLICVVSLLAFGMGLYSVICAYAVSTPLATLYGIWASRSLPGHARAQVEARHIVAFGFPLFISSLAGSLLMRMDLFMVQSLFTDRILTGLYASASAIIKAPYFLSLGTGLVLFRKVVHLRSHRPSEVGRFISKMLYYYILGLAPIPFILSATAEQILSLTFGAHYLAAAPVLRILSFCFVFMILQDMLTNLIAGLGSPGFSMALNLGLVPLQLLFIYWGSFAAGLTGIALATTVSWGLGAVIAAGYLLHKGLWFLPGWKTIFNVGLASALSYCIASSASPSGLWFITFCPIVYLFYLALIRLMGELADAEVRTLLLNFLPASRRQAGA